MNLTLITDATADDEPISISGLEQYLDLPGGAATADLGGLITAARLEAENENGRELARKQWRLSMDAFPRSSWLSVLNPPLLNSMPYWFALSPREITLLDPLVSVESFTYKKSGGQIVTMIAGTDYVVDADKHPGVICAPIGGWPSVDLWPSSAVQIAFTAGHTRDTCPGTIKQGMLLLCTEWYERRMPFADIRFVAEFPFSVTSLFRNDKLWRF